MRCLCLQLKATFECAKNCESFEEWIALTGYMHSGEPRDSVKLRAAELMGKHYGLFTERIEAVVPERSAEEIRIELTAKLQQFLLPEAS